MKINSFILTVASILLLFPVTAGASEIEEQLSEVAAKVAELETQQAVMEKEQETLKEEINTFQSKIEDGKKKIKKLTEQQEQQTEALTESEEVIPVANLKQMSADGPNQISIQLRSMSAITAKRKAVVTELDVTEDSLKEERELIEQATKKLELAKKQQMIVIENLTELVQQLATEKVTQDKLVQEKAQADKVKESGFASPLTMTLNVSSGFGSREDPTGVSGTQHNGIDFTGTMGETILAARDGVVVEAAFGSGQGNCVILQHDNGYYSYYMHLTDISVQVGQTVTVGQQVGTMGTTGASTGVHLHFGLSTSLWSDYVDPTPFLGLS